MNVTLASFMARTASRASAEAILGPGTERGGVLLASRYPCVLLPAARRGRQPTVPWDWLQAFPAQLKVEGELGLC